MGRVGGANDNDEEEMEGVGVALMRGRGGAPAAGGGEKQRAPYLMHRLRGEANVVEFCPFEDCLGIGHSGGFTSIIVPGLYISFVGMLVGVKLIVILSRAQVRTCMYYVWFHSYCNLIGGSNIK